MKKCSSCGKTNDDSNSFCENCGTAIPITDASYSINESNSWDAKEVSEVTPIDNLPHENANQGYHAHVQTNGFAIASFVLSILGFFSCCCAYIGIPLCILGIVFGVIAKNSIKKMPHLHKGSGFYIAGIIISVVGLVFSGIFLLLTLLGASTELPFDNEFFKNLEQYQQ